MEKKIFFKSDLTNFRSFTIVGSTLGFGDLVDTVSLLNYGAGDVGELTVETTWKRPSEQLLAFNKTAKMWAYFLTNLSPG